MQNKYISFAFDDKDEMARFAKMISALQGEGVYFKIEKDVEYIRVYIS